MEFQKSVIEIINSRESKRTFANKSLSKDIIAQIGICLEKYTIGVFGNNVKFYFVEKDFASENKKVKLGTYGFITGAKYFIAGEVKRNNFVFEDFGYLMEKIILHMTDMNLGTCWLGGTFSRSAFALATDIDKEHIIPAVTPVGYATDSKTLRERLIRFGAKANSRKAWEELFFSRSFSTSLSKEAAGLFCVPLQMVQWAPSASNKQPWRIVKENNVFHFYLKRSPGYNKYFKDIDLQKIDMGIAMSHFELACTKLGLNGNWQQNNIENISNDFEYIISWVAD